MPRSNKLTWAQLRVGLMAIAACVILVVLIFLMTGSRGFFAKEFELSSFVADSASLTVGAPVRINGIPAGNVSDVRLTEEADETRRVEILMSIDEGFLDRIPADSQASIDPEGVFGDKFVAIRLGKGTAMVQPGGEVPSLDTREFQEVVNQSYSVLTSLRSITARVDRIMENVEQGEGTIGKLLSDEQLYNRIDGVVARADHVVARIDKGEGTLGRLLTDDSIYEQVYQTTRRVDTLVADVQAGNGTVGMLLKDPRVYEDARRLMANANKLVDGVNSGEGTLGKLIKDDAVYNRANQTMESVAHMVHQLNTGQGTLGQLLVNRALYDSSTGMTTQVKELIQDIRENPKKFLRVKLSIF